ncbi:hypothetical protein, partial [Streptomyces sp. NPDC005209]|uniref:hypothetical protein n=1 Tax=Streptomyces sp. NPDC005209 TaxID=3156715 RepID=UPI0033B52A40
MSRCAGTHSLRPPLPLDRLVPERLHTSKDAASAAKRAAGILRAVRTARSRPPCGGRPAADKTVAMVLDTLEIRNPSLRER